VGFHKAKAFNFDEGLFISFHFMDYASGGKTKKSAQP